MTDEYYPPGAFYFSVQVLGSGTALSVLTGIDASFQEASGIQAEFGVEEVTEGGENRFVHRLPRAPPPLRTRPGSLKLPESSRRCR